LNYKKRNHQKFEEMNKLKSEEEEEKCVTFFAKTGDLFSTIAALMNHEQFVIF